MRGSGVGSAAGAEERGWGRMGAEEGRRSSGVRHRAGVPSRSPAPSSPAPAQGPSRVGDQRLRHPHGPKDTHRGSQCPPCPPPRGRGCWCPLGDRGVTEQPAAPSLCPVPSGVPVPAGTCLSVRLSVCPSLFETLLKKGGDQEGVPAGWGQGSWVQRLALGCPSLPRAHRPRAAPRLGV